MTDPTTFEPLAVTGYEVTYDPRTASDFADAAEGETFEHARIDLPNGYSVSVARTNVGEAPNSIGYENGRWEAAFIKKQTNPLLALLGGEHVRADELDHLTTHEVENWRVVGNLDNAGIQLLLDTVAGIPAPVEETEALPSFTDEDLFAEFFGPQSGEEEGA